MSLSYYSCMMLHLTMFVCDVDIITRIFNHFQSPYRCESACNVLSRRSKDPRCIRKVDSSCLDYLCLFMVLRAAIVKYIMIRNISRVKGGGTVGLERKRCCTAVTSFGRLLPWWCAQCAPSPTKADSQGTFTSLWALLHSSASPLVQALGSGKVQT